MQTCSNPAPIFAAYSLVCTALTDDRRSGMVHHVVSDTTAPGSLQFRYHMRQTVASPAKGRKP